MKTTTRENVAKTTPLAMHAVTTHMVDRGLPTPFSITAPCGGQAAIIVSLPSTAADTWLDSIVVDGETSEPSALEGHNRFTYSGRLHDGVRVVITCVRRAPVLTVVPA